MKALLSAVAIDPEDCPHVSINREGDEWVCNSASRGTRFPNKSRFCLFFVFDNKLDICLINWNSLFIMF